MQFLTTPTWAWTIAASPQMWPSLSAGISARHTQLFDLSSPPALLGAHRQPVKNNSLCSLATKRPLSLLTADTRLISLSQRTAKWDEVSLAKAANIIDLLAKLQREQQQNRATATERAITSSDLNCRHKDIAARTNFIHLRKASSFLCLIYVGSTLFPKDW